MGVFPKAFFLTIMLALGCGCQTLSTVFTQDPMAGAPFSGDEDFRRWFAFYYEERSPDRVGQSVVFMSANGYLREYPDISSVFLGRVFKEHPSYVERWLDAWQPLNQEAWDVFLVSLWLADDPSLLESMKIHMARGSATQQERLIQLSGRDPKEADLLTNDVRDPRHINLLWSAFSATGDERYVRRVIAYVRFFGGEEGDLANAVGEAALMTLASNVGQHSLVERICNEETAVNADQRTRVLLTTMFTVLAQIKAEQTETSVPAH